MGHAGKLRNTRKLTISAVIAISLMLVLTAVAYASSEKAVWSGGGEVIYVGPSMAPSIVTSTQSDFEYDRRGRLRSVTIKTSNELVIGSIGSPTDCRDRRGSNACEKLAEMLANSTVTSLHDSVATLKRIQESEIQVPVGGSVLNVPVLSGALDGHLKGVFGVGTAEGGTEGTASLRIGRGSTGTYACFLPTAAGLVPLETLDPCIGNAGGQMFPVLLSVTDTGTFELGQGYGSMEDLISVKGRVIVKAEANLLLQQIGGKIEISRAVADVAEDKSDDDNRPKWPWNWPTGWNNHSDDEDGHGKFDRPEWLEKFGDRFNRSEWAEKFEEWKNKSKDNPAFAKLINWFTSAGDDDDEEDDDDQNGRGNGWGRGQRWG